MHLAGLCFPFQLDKGIFLPVEIEGKSLPLLKLLVPYVRSDPFLGWDVSKSSD